MQDLALFAFPHFEDHGVQPVAHPPDGAILLRDVRPLIEPVRALEQFVGLFKSDAALWIRPQSPTFADIEAESREYNCYTANSSGALTLRMMANDDRVLR